MIAPLIFGAQRFAMTASLATDNSTETMQASVGGSMGWASGELPLMSIEDDDGIWDDVDANVASTGNASTLSARRMRRQLRRLMVPASAPVELVALVNTLLTLALALMFGVALQLTVILCWARCINRKYYRQVAAETAVRHRVRRRWQRLMHFRLATRGSRVRSIGSPVQALPCRTAPVAPTDGWKDVDGNRVSARDSEPAAAPAPAPAVDGDLPDLSFVPFPKLFVWPNVLVLMLAMFSAGLTRASVTLLAAQPEGCNAGCYAVGVITLAGVVCLLLSLAADLVRFRRRFSDVTFNRTPRATQPNEVDDPCMWIYAQIRLLLLTFRFMLRKGQQLTADALEAVEDALESKKQFIDDAFGTGEEAVDGLKRFFGLEVDPAQEAKKVNAATTIQKYWRRHATPSLVRIRAATKLQALSRQHRARALCDRSLQQHREHMAARYAQRAWRHKQVPPSAAAAVSRMPTHHTLAVTHTPVEPFRSPPPSPPSASAGHRLRVVPPSVLPSPLASPRITRPIQPVAQRSTRAVGLARKKFQTVARRVGLAKGSLISAENKLPRVSRAGGISHATRSKFHKSKALAHTKLAEGKGLANRPAGHFSVPTTGMAEPDRTERILKAPFTLTHKVPGDAYHSRTGFLLFRVNALSPIGYAWRLIVVGVNVVIGVLGGLSPLIAPKGPTSAAAIAQAGIIFLLQLGMSLVCFCVRPDSDRIFSQFAGTQYLIEATGTACRLWGALLPKVQLLGDTATLAFTLALGAIFVPMMQVAESKIFSPFVKAVRRRGCDPVQAMGLLMVICVAIPRHIRRLMALLTGSADSGSSLDTEKAATGAGLLVGRTMAQGRTQKRVKRKAQGDEHDADDDADADGDDADDGDDGDGGD